jgi:fibronectin type III domain protein
LYKASVRVDGVDATVTPSLLSFTRPGQTQTIKVTLNRRSAPLGEVAFGSLALQTTGVTVRIPIAVTPRTVDAPARVTGSGISGSLTYSVKPGISGPFRVIARGLDAAAIHQGEVTDEDPEAHDQYPAVIPAGTKVARFAVKSDDARGDIDLVLFRDGEPVEISGGPSGVESITLFDPEPGEYQVRVIPSADPPGLPSTTYAYRAFAVGLDLSNFSVTPANATVTTSQPFTLTAVWTGLDPALPYLGFVEYPDGTGTMVEIN